MRLGMDNMEYAQLATSGCYKTGDIIRLSPGGLRKINSIDSSLYITIRKLSKVEYVYYWILKFKGIISKLEWPRG